MRGRWRREGCDWVATQENVWYNVLLLDLGSGYIVFAL